MRLERAVALAVTFLPDRELDCLAWRVEMQLVAALHRDRWKRRGDRSTRAELLDTIIKRLQE